MAHQMSVERVFQNGKRLGLREFAASGRFDNFLCKVLGSIAPSRQTQDYYWNVSGEQALAAATEMLEQMNFIGFVEQIEADTNSICQRLKIKPILPTINKSFTNVQVDTQTRTLIEENNSLDLQLFEVAKNLRQNADSN